MRSSRSSPTGRWRTRRVRTKPSPAAARSACCTGCRWLTRIWWPRQESGRREARRFIGIRCRPRTRRSSRASARRARSRSARPTRPSSAPVRRRSTRSSAPRGILRSRQDLRRQQRRRRRGARLRHGPDRRWQRYRRLAAESRGVLQCRRLPAVTGTSTAGVRLVVAALRVRPDGADGRRSRPVLQCPCRAGSP